MGAAGDAGYWETQHAVLVCLAKEEGKDPFSLGMQLLLDQLWMQKANGWEP